MAPHLRHPAARSDGDGDAPRGGSDPREQDDLSEYDSDPDLEIVPTEKLGPLDEVLVQPPQDPEWRP